ncbi:MAG TPA: hypothetical protein VJP80_04800 [Candidatus Saccharimonadales bacterium]|nr:hypothetical protein [Candidatus Saccharimonadales bacterium]
MRELPGGQGDREADTPQEFILIEPIGNTDYTAAYEPIVDPYATPYSDYQSIPSAHDPHDVPSDVPYVHDIPSISDAPSDAPSEVPPITDFGGGSIPPTGTDHFREAAGDEPEPFGVRRFLGKLPTGSEAALIHQSLQWSLHNALRQEAVYEVGEGRRMQFNDPEQPPYEVQFVFLQDDTSSSGNVDLCVAVTETSQHVRATFQDRSTRERQTYDYLLRQGGLVQRFPVEDTRLMFTARLVHIGSMREAALYYQEHPELGELVGPAEAEYLSTTLEHVAPMKFSFDELTRYLEHAPKEIQPSAKGFERSGRFFASDVARVLDSFVQKTGGIEPGTPLIIGDTVEEQGRQLTITLTQEAVVAEGQEPSEPRPLVLFQEEYEPDEKRRQLFADTTGDPAALQAAKGVSQYEFTVVDGNLRCEQTEGWVDTAGAVTAIGSRRVWCGPLEYRILHYLIRDLHISPST